MPTATRKTAAPSGKKATDVPPTKITDKTDAKPAAPDAAPETAGKKTRKPTVDALAGLDFTAELSAPVDVPDTLRSTAKSNPFGPVVKELADALHANGDEIVKVGGGRAFTVPGQADMVTNDALKQAVTKLNKAGTDYNVSVVKSVNPTADGKSTTVLFYVRPRITRKAKKAAVTSSPVGLASGTGEAVAS